MLDKIQANHLVNEIHTESIVLFQGVEEHETEHQCPNHIRKGTHYLNDKLLDRTCVEEASVQVEEAERDDTPDSTSAVDFAHPEWIVDLVPLDNAAHTSINY